MLLSYVITTGTMLELKEEKTDISMLLNQNL